MRILFYLFAFLFIVSCANQGTIQGGEKDETPPQVLGAYPAAGSLNFTANGFVLEFDENIQVRDLNKNLLVSPFLDEKPTIKVRPRSIEVEFNEDLQPNTTYTFNFGNAIQDLNEGNPISGFTYVFSTGDELDQSSLSGTAQYSKTGLVPEEGAWALLYEAGIDSLFQTMPPRYATPILEDGQFSFQNVKEGEYQLYGLRDNNSNYYYDLPNEEIAFISETIFISDSIHHLEPLQLFEQIPQIGFVRKTTVSPKTIVFETSTDADRFSWEFFPDVSVDYISRFQDSVRYWFSGEEIPDSAFLSFDNQVIDTISFAPFEEVYPDTLFKVNIANSQPFSFHKPLLVKAKRPFSKNIDLESILLEDSLFVAGGVSLIQDSLNANQMIVDYPFDYGKEYILQFDDSLFTDIYDLPSDSVGISFTVPELEKLSVLNINLVSENYAESPIIFHLMKGSNIFLSRYLSQVDEDIVIKDLAPGKYTVTIIIDENGNQEWDTGNYDLKIQPEQVLVYSSELELRANWDVNVEINLDE